MPDAGVYAAARVVSHKNTSRKNISDCFFHKLRHKFLI